MAWSKAWQAWDMARHLGFVASSFGVRCSLCFPYLLGGTKKGAGQLLHTVLFMIVLNSFKSKLHLLF